LCRFRRAPSRRSRFSSGQILDGDDLQEAFVATYPKYVNQPGRWFLADRLHEDDRTWVLSKMWGADTVEALNALLTLAPHPGYDYEAG
jgi:hypothetical protein